MVAIRITYMISNKSGFQTISQSRSFCYDLTDVNGYGMVVQ